MKTRKLSGVLFWAVVGFILASVTGFLPIFGAIALQFMNFIPMPPGVLGFGAVGDATPSAEELAAMEKIENRVQKLLHERTLNLITADQFALRTAELSAEIEKKFDEGKFKEMSERISGLAKSISDSKSLTDKNAVQITRRQALRALCHQALTSESFKRLQKGETVKTEEFKLDERAAISVSSDYDGTIGKTKWLNGLEFKPADFAMVRDIFPQGTTTKIQITHPYAKDFNPNVNEYNENEEITDGTFAFDETTSYVQRWGTAFPISKNFLRDGELSTMINIMLGHAEKQVAFRENLLLINGTGAPGKIKGLLNAAPVLTLNGITYVATSVASISELMTGKVIVNFAADHNLRTGYKITFANATHAGYNAQFDVTVRSLRSIIINKSYTAEADTSAWTATAEHPLAKAIDNAKYYDALKTVISSVTFNEFSATGGIIHPIMCDLMYERDTTGQLVTMPGVSETPEIFTLNGVPFVKSTAIPMKTVFCGDLGSAAEVDDLEGMTMQLSEDTEDKRKNQYTIIISQQTGMPIINQYVMVQANLDTIKTAIEKP